MSLFDEIRNECGEVAEGVAFRADRLHAAWQLCGLVGVAELAAPELNPGPHFLGHDERTLAFILILDSTNFGWGWFPQLRKRPGKSGSLTVMASLRDAFDTGEDFSADRLARITADDCARLFGQDPHATPVKGLLGKFAQALNDLPAQLAAAKLALAFDQGSFRELEELIPARAGGMRFRLGSLSSLASRRVATTIDRRLTSDLRPIKESFCRCRTSTT